MRGHLHKCIASVLCVIEPMLGRDGLLSSIMGAYVKSDSLGGRRGEGSPGLQRSGAVTATVNRETVPVWVDEGCVF